LFNNGNFFSSGFRVSFVFVSPFFTLVQFSLFFFLSSLDVGNGFSQSSLLQFQSGLSLRQLDFQFTQNGGNLGDGLLDFGFQGSVFSNSFLFFSGIINGGGFQIFFQLGQFVDDVGQRFLGEGGGDLDQGGDGVGVSDFGQFSQSQVVVVGVGFNGAQFFVDQVQSGGNVDGLLLSSGEFFGISLSVGIQFSVSVVQDGQLSFFNTDFGGQLADLTVQDGDFVFSFVFFVSVVGDGSVQGGNGVGTFLFLSNVFGISIGLLGGQVLTDFSQHSGDISEGGVGGELEGDGVEQFFSEGDVFEGFQLGEDVESGFGGFFQEHSVGAGQADD